MSHIVFSLDHATIIADFNGGLWCVRCHDNETGREEASTLTEEQFVSLSILLLGGGNPALKEIAAPIAIKAIEEWDINVNPIL